MKQAIMAIRLAYRSRVWARINELESIQAECTDRDWDIRNAIQNELEYLIKKLRSM
jgi:hypothetical protein